MDEGECVLGSVGDSIGGWVAFAVGIFCFLSDLCRFLLVLHSRLVNRIRVVE